MRLPRLFLAVTAALAAALPAAAQAPMAQPRPADPSVFTARDLVNLERVGEVRISPDGRWAVYGLRTTDYEANRGVNHLYVADLRSGAAPRRMAVSTGGASSARWGADGSLYFLSSRSGSSQVWRTDAAGAAATQVTNLPLDVQAFRVSPQGGRLAVALAVFPDCGGDEVTCTLARQKARAANKATGLVFDEIFVRHWDSWADGTRNHLFRVDLDSRFRQTGAPIPLMRGFNGDSPTKPFGDDADFTWTRDGSAVFFTARQGGSREPRSTNFDIYRVPADGSQPPESWTDANSAWDAAPAVSPDGRTLAYLAMSRPGFEADQFDVMLRDLATGRTRNITEAWDRSPDHINWSPDGRTIYASAQDLGQTRVFALDAASGRVRPLTGEGRVTAMDVGPNGLAYVHDDFDSPAQLFRMGPDGTGLTQLTRHNADMMRGKRLGQAEQFSFAGWNGERVYGYVVRPPGLRPGQKVPVAFLIHGGPQGSFGNQFHYRWNPQTYVGRGYAVVMIDFHGSTGYGQAFTDSISRHWGDRPLEDLQKGWAAALERYPYLDGQRACALGGSYGGYMTNWIAGVWSQPWDCLVTHAGIYDTRSMAAATEELWFTEWEFGGSPADSPGAHEEFNPVHHVRNWRTPTLVTQGERDFRVIGEQSLAAFNTLQRRGVPSRLIWYPDENHWILKPQNSVQWHDEVEAWLDRWTAPGGSQTRGMPVIDLATAQRRPTPAGTDARGGAVIAPARSPARRP